MGEHDVFPHVGSRTQLQIPGARREVWPIVTGTFGGVDFLHSVTGEGIRSHNCITPLIRYLTRATYSFGQIDPERDSGA